MPVLADRVQDTTSTNGTGAVTLDNTAPVGFRTFASALGAVSATVDYAIEDSSGNWEVGTGVFNGTTGLTRVSVQASSNANALVTFPSGSKKVSLVATAKMLSGIGTSYESSFLFLGA